MHLTDILRPPTRLTAGGLLQSTATQHVTNQKMPKPAVIMSYGIHISWNLTHQLSNSFWLEVAKSFQDPIWSFKYKLFDSEYRNSNHVLSDVMLMATFNLTAQCDMWRVLAAWTTNFHVEAKAETTNRCLVSARGELRRTQAPGLRSNGHYQ